VVNQSAARCINGIHCVTWRVDDAEAYVLSTWTSLWALALEQSARHYAGGVLKLEPGRAPDLPIVRHDDRAALAQLDRYLRDDGIAAARAYADDLVLRHTLGMSDRQVQALPGSVDSLQRRRSPRIRAGGSSPAGLS
jgi:hypothetical protein